MSRIIFGFVRHADYHQLAGTPSAHQPFALSDKGLEQAKQQAKQFADFLSERGWQLLADFDSSTMLRAWQTAQQFQQVLQPFSDASITIQSYDALAERSVGAVANLTAAQISELVAADPRYADLPDGWKSDSHFCLPFQGAESLMEAGKRVATHITDQMHVNASPQQTPKLKLFFGHGASFRHAAYQLGILGFEDIAKLSMFHAQPLLFEQVSGQWQHIAGDWKKRKANAEQLD